MATAVSLNAISSIINGQGLGVSPAFLAEITTFQNQDTVQTVGNIFINANLSGNAYSNVISALYSLGSGVNTARWLIDYYPIGVTPACSGNIFTYANSANTSSFSSAISTQAQLPFSNGLSGFANVFQRAYGYSQQVFDTIGSITMLKDDVYNQSGVGYTGPVDLVTGGIGTNGNLLANVVSGWGTMYDVNNISQINDPYVFGQNLLNQGLGYVNALSDQLTATGLDVTNLTDRSPTITTTTQNETSVTISTFVGEVEIPTLTETTTTVAVTGNSPTVVLNIYKTVTGSNLQTVANATAITTTPATNANIVTLSDYLNLSKVVSPALLTQLNSLGVTTFDEFSTYLSNKIGQGRFKSWKDLSKFLTSLETPALTNLPTGSNANILYASTVTTLSNQYGTGTGALGNPVIVDYLGACAGDPYSDVFANLNSSYSTISSTVEVALNNLDQAVIDYGTAYAAFDADFYSNVPIGLTEPDIVIITSNVTAVNSALNSISNSSAYFYSNLAYYSAINHMTVEVNNLQKAGIVSFGAGTPLSLLGFAESIGQVASDKTGVEPYQFFANVITDDLAGDTIRAVIAETINNRILNGAGITTYNDPDPRAIVYQSQTQNIPLSTYISRNK